jgi:putative glutamine amidotransferase
MIFPDMRSPRVVKPLIGISCCTKQFGVFGMPNHAASDTYVRATDEVIGAVPVLLPANGPTADIETLLDRLDGIILTGSRSNVQPTLYDGPPHAEGTPEDPARDGITLPLIRAAVARGVPLLAISEAGPTIGYAVGVQWHPEYDWRTDALSRAIFEQFGAAVRAYADAARLGGVSIAAD